MKRPFLTGKGQRPIVFLINEINVRGGTHKQLLKLLDFYDARKSDFIVITKYLDYDLTYPGYKKYEDKIYTLNPGVTKNTINKSRVSRFLNYVTTVYKLVKLIKRFGIDKINVHDNGFEYYYWFLHSQKIYWQVNDLPGCFVPRSDDLKLAGIIKFKTLVRKKIILMNAKYVTDFTVNVSKNRFLIQKHFNRDAQVFYCGVEKVSAAPHQTDSLRRFRERKINLLTSGVFFPYRNYETQILVMKYLLEHGYDVQLNIIGTTNWSPDYANKIKEMIHENSLETAVPMRGQVNEAEFEELHAQSDTFLFININQSWGLAVFEAMCCGLPVVVSNSVGAIELLTDGENAVIVDPLDYAKIAEAIITLTKDEVLYKKLSDEAAALVSNLTWDAAYSRKMFKLMSEDV